MLKMRRESDAIQAKLKTDMMVAKTLGSSVDWSSSFDPNQWELLPDSPSIY